METNSKLSGLESYHRKRNAAWTAMLAAAAQQHAVQPITARRIATAAYATLYGTGAKSLASTYGVRPTTVRTLRRVLGLLLAMAEQNGSPPTEVFQRFKDYNRAERRTLNARRTQRAKARQERM